jgi:hypothetical protein
MTAAPHKQRRGFGSQAAELTAVPLDVGVNQASHSIREQHVNLAWLYEPGYFSFAERGMHHCLSAPIGSRAIIRGANFRRCPARDRALIPDARLADRATDICDSSLFGDGSDNMATLFGTLQTHLLDSISD